MQTIENSKSNNIPGWAQGVLIFITVTTAVALFVVVLAYTGILPTGKQDPALDGQTLTAVNFLFAQEELHLKAGETVRLVLDNQDSLAHSFDVDEWDVHVTMPGNQQVTAEFTPSEPGTYRFYCGVPGHVQAGMVGTIIVKP